MEEESESLRRFPRSGYGGKVRHQSFKTFWGIGKTQRPQPLGIWVLEAAISNLAKV